MEILPHLNLLEKPTVLIQALTSDSKKNWDFNRWAEALRDIRLLNPQINLVLLGAPFERESLKTLASMCEDLGVAVSLVTCSFSGAFSLLKRAQLLISGDTSIKHLASIASCPTIELSMGSSHFYKTGVYRPNNIIVQSALACAPCSHSNPCRFAFPAPDQSPFSPPCGDEISPELVATLVTQMLRGDASLNLKELAEEFRSEVLIYQTQFSPSGYWWPQPLFSQSVEEVLARSLEKSTWKMFLNRDHFQLVAQYGTEVRNILLDVKSASFANSTKDLMTWLIDLEKAEQCSIREMESLQALSRRLNSRDQAKAILKGLIAGLKNQINQDENERLVLSHLLAWDSEDKLKFEMPELRHIQDKMKEIKDKHQIRLKLIRTMQCEQQGWI